MKRLWLILLALLFATNSALAYEFLKDENASFPMPYSQQITLQPGFSLQTERACYLFSAEIDDDTRNQTVAQMEKLMTALDETGFCCYFMPDLSPVVLSFGRQIYLSPTDETGLSHAIALLQAVHGEYAHYGLIFGMADALCKAAGLPGHTRRYNDKGMLRFYNEESNLSDFMLLYPCFTKEHNNEKQLPFVQDMAVRFCDFLAEKNQLLPLLREKDAARFQAAYISSMNAFLKNAGAETQLYTHLPAIQFAAGGEEIPIIIQNAHGEWRIYQNFSDPISYWAESSFDTLFNLIWKMDDDLKMVDDALGIAPIKRVFSFGGEGGQNAKSLYIHNQGDIFLTLPSIVSLMHEYTHAVTAPLYTGENSWFLSELAATYFEIQGKENPQDELVYTLRYDLSRDQESYWEPVLKAMEKGSPLSYWPNPADVYHYLCYSHKQYDLFTPGNRTLNSLRSFAYFLSEHYGNEKMGPVFAAGSPLEMLHKDWADLQKEWQDHLQSMFGQGGSL